LEIRPTPCAGMTQIRFEGLRPGSAGLALSALARSPVVFRTDRCWSLGEPPVDGTRRNAAAPPCACGREEPVEGRAGRGVEPAAAEAKGCRDERAAETRGSRERRLGKGVDAPTVPRRFLFSQANSPGRTEMTTDPGAFRGLRAGGSGAERCLAQGLGGGLGSAQRDLGGLPPTRRVRRDLARTPLEDGGGLALAHPDGGGIG